MRLSNAWFRPSAQSKPSQRLARRTIDLLAVSGVIAVLCTGCSAAGGNGTEFDQAEALSDEEVSDAEYRLSKEAEVRCLEERGWEVTDLMPSPDGMTLFYNIQISDDRDPGTDSSDCATEYSLDVEQAYIQQHKLTGAEKEAGLDALFQCFVDIPIEGVLRSDSSKQLLFKASEQYPDPNSEEFDAALNCMEANKWAITDQDAPE